MTSKQEINEDVRKLVIARIDANMPANIKMSIGGGGTLSKDEMIEHVKKGDKQGIQIMEMHMNFLRAVANGQLARELNKV